MREKVVEVGLPGGAVLALFRLFGQGERARWVCGWCAPALRAGEWLGKDSQWARDECDRRGWPLREVEERQYPDPGAPVRVACGECAHWAGVSPCGAGRVTSGGDDRVSLCGRYEPRKQNQQPSR